MGWPAPRAEPDGKTYPALKTLPPLPCCSPQTARRSPVWQSRLPKGGRRFFPPRAGRRSLPFEADRPGLQPSLPSLDAESAQPTAPVCRRKQEPLQTRAVKKQESGALNSPGEAHWPGWAENCPFQGSLPVLPEGRMDGQPEKKRRKPMLCVLFSEYPRLLNRPRLMNRPAPPVSSSEIPRRPPGYRGSRQRRVRR